MKYTVNDVEKMIEVFANIAENTNDPVTMCEEMKRLLDYPVSILQQFLQCIECFTDKSENYLSENYEAIIGYIVIRLNIFEMV